MDFDRLYLAEHILYGSSRLGVKNYWPTQYRYEWDMSKTTGQNEARFDSSEVKYRRPWFSKVYSSLINQDYTVPFAHANVQPVYSDRILGQKRYELTNHLGNVMAVTTDKITEVPSTGGTLPVVATKRASLSSAYDYYPFGMLMPERYVEDTSVNCIPVTRTRYIPFVTPNYPEPDPGGGGGGSGSMLRNATGSSEEIHLEYEEGSQTLKIVSASEDFILTVPIPKPPVGSSAIQVVGHIEGGGDEEKTVLLEETRDSVGAEPVVIGQFSLPSNSEFMIEAELSPGISTYQLRILNGLYHDPLLSGFESYVTTLKPQSYVTLSCDTDGRFDDGYRFGFNGQQKDNEIAGVGNTLEFKYRMFDSRLARFKSIDPLAKKYPWNSGYAFAQNSPIMGLDLEGLELINAYYNYSKDGQKLNLKNPNDFEVAALVDEAIDQFKNDDPAAFEYFNQFQIDVTYANLPVPAGSTHYGHIKIRDHYVPAITQTRKLTPAEVYERDHGVGTYKAFSETLGDAWGDWMSWYNQNPQSVTAGTAEIKEFIATITLDLVTLRDNNAELDKKREVIGKTEPGRVLKHELGHYQWNIRYWTPAGFPKNNPDGSDPSEGPAKTYEKTYDGNPKTTTKPAKSIK